MIYLLLLATVCKIAFVWQNDKISIFLSISLNENKTQYFKMFFQETCTVESCKEKTFLSMQIMSKFIQYEIYILFCYFLMVLQGNIMTGVTK
jgi:hypothetical protein